MKVLIHPHGGSGNHGCEAIVRSTVTITGADVRLYSSNVAEDRRYGLDKVCRVYSDRQSLTRWSWPYIRAIADYWVRKDAEAYDRALYRPVFHGAKDVDVALSAGGDNYCYAAPVYTYIVNKQLRRMGIPTVLWGCSIESSVMDGRMLEDLQGYCMIVARESITHQNLIDSGLKNVVLYPDPAFALKTEKTELIKGLHESNTVGINISPLLISMEQKKEITLRNYERLLSYIIDNTDMQIALIPHVVWSDNDDRRPLQILYDKFYDTGRVAMVLDAPTIQLKTIIASCRLMIAARTHASIAAYSSEVPTLVVGYSVKARGIARDIFGTDEHYVLPVQSLQSEDDLVHAFQWLMSHETNIRLHYANFMPDYIGQTKEAEQLLKQL